MTTAVKLLIDECFGHPMVRQLGTFLRRAGYEVECKHIHDFQFGGIPDDQWVPRIADDGWIVITADGGRQRSVGQKLPKVCRAYGVTHVIMSPKLHERTQYFKLIKIMELAQQLIALASVSRGSCYSMRLADRDRAVLVERSQIFPEERTVPKVQKSFPTVAEIKPELEEKPPDGK